MLLLRLASFGGTPQQKTWMLELNKSKNVTSLRDCLLPLHLGLFDVVSLLCSLPLQRQWYGPQRLHSKSSINMAAVLRTPHHCSAFYESSAQTNAH